MSRITFAETLEKNVPDRPERGCWLWAGALDGKGYGQVNRDGKVQRAHRYIYQGLRGQIPSGNVLRHSCDTPLCVNPAHLDPGTDGDNVKDMVSRGRNARGSTHRAAKLNEETVMEIRRKYATGKFSQVSLAAEYGLTPTPMSQLLRGVTWKHIPLVDRVAA